MPLKIDDHTSLLSRPQCRARPVDMSNYSSSSLLKIVDERCAVPNRSPNASTRYSLSAWILSLSSVTLKQALKIKLGKETLSGRTPH